jgi:hypothetical protein
MPWSGPCKSRPQVSMSPWRRPRRQFHGLPSDHLRYTLTSPPMATGREAGHLSRSITRLACPASTYTPTLGELVDSRGGEPCRFPGGDDAPRDRSLDLPACLALGVGGHRPREPDTAPSTGDPSAFCPPAQARTRSNRAVRSRRRTPPRGPLTSVLGDRLARNGDAGLSSAISIVHPSIAAQHD